MDFFGILIFGVVVGILFGIGQIILTLNKKKEWRKSSQVLKALLQVKN